MKRRLLLFLAAILTALPGCSNDSFSSGDRVLVAKFLYDTHLTEPNRFDVVVFKYPQEPIEKNVPKNYIKRLLGLPGEIIAIFFGRLYRMPAPNRVRPLISTTSPPKRSTPTISGAEVPAAASMKTKATPSLTRANSRSSASRLK